MVAPVARREGTGGFYSLRYLSLVAVATIALAMVAWIVQNRLVAISPASYPLRRDLALIAQKAQHSATAARLLKSLLNSCPDDEQEFLTSQLEEAQRDIPRWN